MNTNWKIFKISKENDSKKILNFIKDVLYDYPISLIYKLFRQKDIKINDQRISNEKLRIKTGDMVSIFFAKEIKTKKESKTNIDIDFRIIYEDKNILLINKPSGISIHSESNSLDLQVLKYLNYKNEIGEFRASHVGRLDKETSGLIIYAKNYFSVAELNRKINSFEKIYAFKSDYNGLDREINLLIEKNKNNFLKAKIINSYFANKNTAKTYIYKKNNVWYAKLLSGKKHQIRLSMKCLNAPIYGDKKYNGPKANRLYLHCNFLKFKNLKGKLEYLNDKEFYSPIPWKEK
ncbi:pseudouridine synthase [Mycoplasmopsis meleagridis]|uniref:pseudouridine synthase n=1 Tax=Mycoplasmopsis meleagridis TaxID=29561 RepID=UPI003A84C7D9